MKSLPWIFAGVGLGFAALVLFTSPSPRYATGSEDIADAADETGWWGSKQRVAGTGRNLAGRVKEGLGRFSGSDELAEEGVADQVEGAVRNIAGKAAQVVSNNIHELNR